MRWALYNPYFLFFIPRKRTFSNQIFCSLTYFLFAFPGLFFSSGKVGFFPSVNSSLLRSLERAGVIPALFYYRKYLV